MSATMFNAIVWKELRQNLKWGVVVLAGMATVLAIATRSIQDELNVVSWIAGALDAITTIGAALAGLLIGAMQVIGESRGDKWGFLVHRPVSRSTLFWGKAAAGTLLYALSTGLPFAAALSWIATPGYLPVPFDWRIALPGVSSLLVGLVFYFAGLLTAMREARWYASRALGIGAACWCLILQAAVPEFWQAAAGSAAGVVTLGTAAWSTFISGGQYGAQPRIGRIATSLSIGAGMTLAGFALYAFSAFQLEVFGARAQPVFRNTSIAVTNDGVVMRIMGDNTGIVEVSDLDGHPRELPGDVAINRIPLAPMVGLSVALPAVASFRSTERLFTRLSPPTSSNPVWYFVHRLGMISAFDSRSRKLIGWIGPDGFSPGDARPRPFSGPLRNRISPNNGLPLFLVHDDAVHRVDLGERGIERIFQPEAVETPLAAGSPTYYAATLENHRDTAGFEVIATTRRVVIQLRDGARLLEIPQDASTAGYSSLQVYRPLRSPGAPTFVWYRGIAGGQSQISRYDSTGALVKSWTLPPATLPVSSMSRTQVAVSSAITPLIGQALMELADRRLRVESSGASPARTTYWAVAILSSLISAAVAFLHGRRYAFSPGRLGLWTGLALLLGPLGYLLMLALIEWPALESCPACRRKRVVTREHCEHCGERFAPPPGDGTEIFEPMPQRAE